MADKNITRKSTSIEYNHLPTHLAIVPDGNGRWAELNGLSRIEGHRAGLENMRRMINYISEYPIKYVTIYGFSTENWLRPDNEVKGIFDLLEEVIDEYTKEIHQKGVKLLHIGRLNELPQSLQKAINRSIELTKNNTGMTLSIALNYGGRAEIVDATRHLISTGVSPQNLNEESFASYLYTNGIPDVDLLVRTGDVVRLSNFLIWQTAYSEYYFSKVLWPNFRKKDMDKALSSYSQRKRRFGGL